MLVYKAQDIGFANIFHNLSDFFGIKSAFVKYEGLNIAGSIKLKTAQYLINGLEKKFNITPCNNTIIESSSGNLGIALSIVCKSKGYKFICITDPNTLAYAECYMKLYGAEVIKVIERDESGGFLGTRIKLINQMLKNDPGLIWTNQYASEYNINAHYETTAKEIYEFIPDLDYLFIGAGTTGTLVGCAKFFKEHAPKTRIIAVDNKGSITFGFPPGPRYIPGIGTSRKPEIVSLDNVHDVVLVSEPDAVTTCNYLLKKYGLFLGGSSGAVIYAAKTYLSSIKDKNVSFVLISPDFGEKYVDTIYNPAWVEEKFGSTVKQKAFYGE
jgi:cysteine synthase A